MGLLDSLKKSAMKAAEKTLKEGILFGRRVRAEKLAEKWPEVKRNASRILVTVESTRRDWSHSEGEKEEVYLVHQARIEEKKELLGRRKVVKLLVSGPYKPEEAPDYSEHFEREDVWEIEVDPGRELEITASRGAWEVLK
ncbi:hypothetical protein [Thermococcus sp.]